MSSVHIYNQDRSLEVRGPTIFWKFCSVLLYVLEQPRTDNSSAGPNWPTLFTIVNSEASIYFTTLSYSKSAFCNIEGSGNCFCKKKNHNVELDCGGFSWLTHPYMMPSFMKSPKLVLWMLLYVVVTFVEYNDTLWLSKCHTTCGSSILDFKYMRHRWP